MKLSEIKGYDSQYLQKALRDIADDDDELEKVLNSLADRLNQTFPDGDVSVKDIRTLLNEPDNRKLVTRSPMGREEIIKYIWDSGI